MNVLDHPRHPLVQAALGLARKWCAGQVIDGAPALAHAVKVAKVVVGHVPAAHPDLVAAVLLHDSPYFAPAEVDLDAVLTGQLSAAVTRIVRGLHRGHRAMGRWSAEQIDTGDAEVLLASAADKVVSLSSVLTRANAATDPGAFWAQRQAFVRAVPYFRAFYDAAAPRLPGSLASDLAVVVNAAAEAVQGVSHLERT